MEPVSRVSKRYSGKHQFVDGANTLQTLLEIKVPMIANTFTNLIFLTLVELILNSFDLNLAITNGAPNSYSIGKNTGTVSEFLELIFIIQRWKEPVCTWSDQSGYILFYFAICDL